MSRALALLAPFAVLQMALPAPAQAAFVLVPICGEPGHSAPIRVPGRNDAPGDGPGGAPCCKVCHIAMRKRIGGDSTCCHDDHCEDEADGG
ncbi:hypothetical protein [Novosphingobium huizhouense]|uniref:hypothetical protein n=1 Tax=Novosphingobium huizhouense TaxID=2866625 RepID=UPI001CD825F0|nr:hypothetical protein [Novosphingobium huizhouense]